MKKAILGACLGILIFSIVASVMAVDDSANQAPGCKSLYWFDNTNKECGQKQFCGAYMYYGLQTFESKTQCEHALNNSKPECVIDSDCSTACTTCLNDKGTCDCIAFKCIDGKCKEEKTTCPGGSLNEDDKCMFSLSNGRKAEVKIMPETASQTAIAKLGDLGFTIELKEVGKGAAAKLVYELTGNKEGKFLGIFKIMASEKVQVDAETGEVIKVIKPWWSFLATWKNSTNSNLDYSQASDEGIKQVVKANNQFASDLYNKYKIQEGNVFFSPYSISSALAMTYEGAKGKTADEMKSVFHFPESNILEANFASIYNQLNQKNREYQLNTANALWAEKSYQFLPDYFNLIGRYYGGKVTNLDFISQAEQSRQAINKWVEEQTNNKIKDLIPQGILTSDTRLVLTNAIYFKGTWIWQFDKKDTREQDFKVTPTNTVKAQMMHMSPDKATFNYAENDEMQILELPYKGDGLSMLVILPENSLDSLDINAAKIESYKSMMKEEKLDNIYLPKFKFETKYFMSQDLIDMGMPTAFSPRDADFSGMDGTRDLFISEVIHQAFVQVDEEGTEAAAATAVAMAKGIAAEPKIFRADHPFIFIIQDKKTGEVLFMGRVSDPTK